MSIKTKPRTWSQYIDPFDTQFLSSWGDYQIHFKAIFAETSAHNQVALIYATDSLNYCIAGRY